MNKSEIAYSVDDIYNFLTNASIDVENLVMHVEFIEELDYNLSNIFNKNFSVILFIKSPAFDETLPNDVEGNIGHFVLLSQLTDNKLEYFDSLAGEIPEIVKKLADINRMEIISMSKPLQTRESYICAKYCISRMQSLPLSLTLYQNLLRNHKTMSPDEIIHNLYKNKKQNGY